MQSIGIGGFPTQFDLLVPNQVVSLKDFRYAGAILLLNLVAET